MKILITVLLLLSTNTFAHDDFSCDGIRPFKVSPFGLCEDYINPLATICTIDCDLTENRIATCGERLILENKLWMDLIDASWEEREFRMENLRAAKDVCVPGVK